MLNNRIAWAAGFFDGEGCIRIGITMRPNVSKPQISLIASVVNTDRRPIEVFAEIFPGFCGKRTRVKQWLGPKGNPVRRTQYEWNVRGVEALEMCKVILPYSIVKHEQLQLAVEFYNLPWRSQRTTNSGGGSKIRTAENVAVDLDYARRMRELKYAS